MRNRGMAVNAHAGLQRGEARGEVAQRRRRARDAVAAQLAGLLGHALDDLDRVVDV